LHQPKSWRAAGAPRRERFPRADLDVDVDGDVNVDVVDPSTQPAPRTSETPHVLSFQRLDVYRRAIQFLALSTEIVEELPRGHAERADQLVRAAQSVVRNIAEGAGRWSTADSSKHYRIARGEAMECAASLDVLQLRRLITADRYDSGLRLLEAVVAMLTKML
jgi:four helix bundle protein